MSAPDPDLHTLTGTYSVHALPEAERVAFEGHVTACESCAQEVRELVATAERLGLATAAVPPPELKQRVLREIATVRQYGRSRRVRPITRTAAPAAVRPAATENITVFAPTNAAFEKIPEKDLDAVMSDKKMLTDILTYHVVGKKLTPKDMESGSYPTLQKSKLTTAGSGEEYKVNKESNIVCGNVPTANATVYLIDTVLMPK